MMKPNSFLFLCLPLPSFKSISAFTHVASSPRASGKVLSSPPPPPKFTLRFAPSMAGEIGDRGVLLVCPLTPTNIAGAPKGAYPYDGALTPPPEALAAGLAVASAGDEIGGRGEGVGWREDEWAFSPSAMFAMPG